MPTAISKMEVFGKPIDLYNLPATSDIGTVTTFIVLQL